MGRTRSRSRYHDFPRGAPGARGTPGCSPRRRPDWTESGWNQPTTRLLSKSSWRWTDHSRTRNSNPHRAGWRRTCLGVWGLWGSEPWGPSLYFSGGNNQKPGPPAIRFYVDDELCGQLWASGIWPGGCALTSGGDRYVLPRSGLGVQLSHVTLAHTRPAKQELGMQEVRICWLLDDLHADRCHYYLDDHLSTQYSSLPSTAPCAYMMSTTFLA